MKINVPGTQGYAERAQELIARYESESFEHKHRTELIVLPTVPVLALDIGAGTGADAAWLAGQGHSVLAVEPTEPFRAAGKVLHPHTGIEWMDDSLPNLAAVRARQQRFGLIMLTAVWMHLDPEQRRVGMKTLASLLEPNGVIVMSLRHGAVPEGRCMFEVSGAETVALASECGLACVLNVVTESSGAANRAAGVAWTRLALMWAAKADGTLQNAA
jgi:2-polyprenyl-3-methyl-5-hydroxy-6-metoxy-1,4-benzoquinol methylase